MLIPVVLNHHCNVFISSSIRLDIIYTCLCGKVFTYMMSIVQGKNEIILSRLSPVHTKKTMAY